MRALGAVVLTLVTILAAAATGCGGQSLPPGAEPYPNGGQVPGIPKNTCGADGTYYTVKAAQCGYLNCPDMSGPAYALCDGMLYSACTCQKPPADSGWTSVGP